MSAMFAFLNGAAPWWWLIAALALGALEMLSFSYILLWPGLAALAVGLWLFLQPDLGGGGQVALFAVLSLAFTVAGRALVMRRPAPAGGRPGLNQRAARLIGRQAVVATQADGTAVEVEIDGELWRARCALPLTAGATVRITGVDGAILEVTSADNKRQA